MGSQHNISALAQRLSEFIKQAADKPELGHLPTKGPARTCTKVFEELALQLFALQFENNLRFRRYCQKVGQTPNDVEHWSQIPPVPTAAFKEFELTCLPSHQRTKVFHSSGTTEQRPSRHFHSTSSLAVYELALLPWFRRHLLPETCETSSGRMRIISLTPSGALAPHSSLAHMFEAIIREVGLSDSLFIGKLARNEAWELDHEKLVSELKASTARDEPVLLLGTAFLFVHLLEHFERQGLRLVLPAGSRLMETGGYKGRSRTFSKSQLYRMLESRLGFGVESIVGEYGMSELSSQAYDHAVSGTPEASSGSGSQQRSFRFPPWAKVQIVSPETGREVAEGERGLLRIFDLANAWSVLAIQTEDIVIRRGGGFELLGRAAAAEPRGCSLMAADSL